MKRALMSLLVSSSLLSSEHYLNVTPSVGFRSFGQDSGLEMDYRLAHVLDDRAIIFNPRVMATVSKAVRSGVGVGLRHELGEWTTGVFAFAHHAYWKSAHIFQVGPTIELLGPYLDIRLNIFAPLGKSRKFENDPYVETELAFKTAYFHAGAGPCFNVEKKRLGAMGRITIPIGFGSISLHLGCDPNRGFVGKLSFTILRFGKAPSTEFTPIIERPFVPAEVRRECPPLIHSKPMPKETPLNQCIVRPMPDLSYPANKEPTDADSRGKGGGTWFNGPGWWPGNV